MGWNGKSSPNVSWSLSWKDEVGDKRIDEFDEVLRKEVENFIADRIEKEFETEIKNDRLNYMCGDRDSY